MAGDRGEDRSSDTPARSGWLERWLEQVELSRVQATVSESAYERVRFARTWLDARRDAPLQRPEMRETVAANDRVAYLWSLHGAHDEHLDAKLLVGHCYREGRGTGRNLGRARRWYRAAAEQGCTEAAYWLKQTGADASAWLLSTGPTMRRWLGWLGWALLLGYLAWAPWRFSVGAVVAYVLIACVGQVVVRRLLTPRRERSQPSRDARVGDQLVEGLSHRPWRTVHVAGEDGLVLVPLLLLAAASGSVVWVAPVAGMLFGLLHRPHFSWRACTGKGLAYAVAAAVVLPWGGLAAMAMGHVLLDAALVGLHRVSATTQERGPMTPEPLSGR